MNNNEQLNLTPFQRQEKILEYINRHSSASVKQLAEEFYLHEATVRRDLNALAKAGQISRIHGGAAAMDAFLAEIPLFVRETAFKEIKREIAAKAASLVKDGNTIFIDSSSTATLMIPYLKNRRSLRIVTDGIQTCMHLSKLTDAQIFCVGGCLRENSLSLIGTMAMQSLAKFHFDFAFFSCRGVSIKNGLTDTSEEEAFFREKLIECSDQAVLLADHSKIGVNSFFNIAPFRAIDAMITDAVLCDEWHHSGVKIISP
ncbi:MAG: DeoR/GlpR transcriptional regulator [Clostridia bacterium]|nr:DeoR/GlpR transcriptional regulator [Clostridia bacterium]